MARQNKKTNRPKRVVLPRPDWAEATAKRYLDHIKGTGTNVNESTTWAAADTVLEGLRFDGLYLRLMSFVRSTIVGCSFKDADLRSAVFLDAVLQDCDFSGADLRNACFTGATLTNCKLDTAVVTGADFMSHEEKEARMTAAIRSNWKVIAEAFRIN